MYASNISDMAEHHDDLGVQIMIGNVVHNNNRIVNAERDNFDGAAIVWSCDDERGAAIVDILRKKFKKHELRMYHSKTGNGSWKRV